MAAERIFAACAPGLEPVLAAELAGLGLDARAVPGGAEASGVDAIAVACVASRVADAVAVRLWRGEPRAADAALAAVRRRLGPGPRLAVRRSEGAAIISADAVGGPLYKRGWRARVGAAPLRESLAAGMLLAAGYDGSRPFLDPMCGSGTLGIEAALLATRRAPGLARRFAFESWPGHDPRRAEEVRARFSALERAAPAPLHLSDRNAGAVRLAARNAAAAAVADLVRIERRDAAAAAPPGAGPGLVAVNPPYGLRLAEDAAAAWRALAALLDRLPGWTAVVLAPDRGLASLLRRRPSRSVRVRNGGLACLLLTFAG